MTRHLPQAAARRRPFAAGLALCAALAAHPAHAYVVEGSWRVFSRSCAPLGLQESVSYSSTYQQRLLAIESHHFPSITAGAWSPAVPPAHAVSSYWHRSWRSAAGHQNEYYWGYVVGVHWGADSHGDRYVLWMSDARDCNLNEL